MSDKTRNRLEAIASQFDLIASRTTPLYSVALRVTNTSIKILLPEHLNAIDNPHRGSGDLLAPQPRPTGCNDPRNKLAVVSICLSVLVRRADSKYTGLPMVLDQSPFVSLVPQPPCKSLVSP